MNDETQIRRRPDGSIDTAYYVAKASRCRSEAAHEMTSAIGSSARRPLIGLAALAALFPFFG